VPLVQQTVSPPAPGNCDEDNDYAITDTEFSDLGRPLINGELQDLSINPGPWDYL